MSERSDSFSSGLFADEVDCRDDDGGIALTPLLAMPPIRAQTRDAHLVGLADDARLVGLADDARLVGLADLASVDIETSLVTDLSDTLHSLFDPVCDKTLPIYFGPLLGRLYLEGL